MLIAPHACPPIPANSATGPVEFDLPAETEAACIYLSCADVSRRGQTSTAFVRFYRPPAGSSAVTSPSIEWLTVERQPR